MAQSQGLCACLPNSTAVMMSEGKSISSDFLRLGRISEPMSWGFLCVPFGALEKPWEPINPGCLCPSLGKTSSSAVAQRATTRELGWALQTFPRLRLSLDCFVSTGIQIQGCGCPESHVDSVAVAQGRERGVLHSEGCLSRGFPLFLRNAVGLKVNHPPSVQGSYTLS